MNTESESLSYTQSSQPKTFFSDGGTNVPIIHIDSWELEEKQQNKSKPLPKLPSHNFQYTVWHELRSTKVKGDELHAPRIREGPADKEEQFYTATDNFGQLIHHDKKGKERDHHRDSTESWETAQYVNLSYQKLNHSYQRENLMRILHRLKEAEEINLIDNGLVDLSKISLSKCIKANLSKNYLNSFNKLPRMPSVSHLILAGNQIGNLAGLKRFPNLKQLDLHGNGVTFTRCYRQRVFKILPNLELLDNTLRQAEDLEEPEAESAAADGQCVIL